MQTVGLIHTLEQCLNRMQTVGLIHTLEQCLNRMQTVGLIHTLEQCLNRMQTVELIHSLEQCLNRMQTVELIHSLEQCLNRMQTVGLIHTLEQCPNRMQTCCVCVERYLAVLHPLTFLRYRPLRYRVGCSALVWMITFGGCLAFMLLQLLLNYTLVVFIILLLSVMSFCCLAVLRALRSPGPGEGEGQGPHLAKKRAFRIITVNLVFTLATYLPLIVAAFLYSEISDRSFYTVHATCYSISVFCSLLQPLHFLSRAGKLQCIMGH
ncbi:hypothetical protein AAFF_G00293300 [Aldrovandia affinis]|uniref:G-protein coupled receptors family 1 profile domain-containing protein n=1 Tax=Aldrovandia affinis TaxID=143900 RepID=A0AAD7W0S1_9TELE|nr:hypothetical protein AAFF_G00293300 [Aldrovandia affinis]